MFAFYQDGATVNIIPAKDSGYELDTSKTNCTNGASITWNNDAWEPTVKNLTTNKTKCNLYFIMPVPAYEKVIKLSQTDKTNLAIDEAGNVRYIGANPNNYVTFNGEDWQIIGAFKDIDDGTGKLEWRTKIIKNGSLGNKQWHTSAVNEWTTASLNSELNGSYYNGLSAGAQEMIGNTKWDINKAPEKLSPIDAYSRERGGATWTGKIGLMYPSDYGYAVGGESRTSCLNTSMYDWNSHSECTGNDWLIKTYEWTLTGDSSNGSHVLYIGWLSYVGGVFASTTGNVSPTLYLSSNVMILGGSGTVDDPYQLTI